MNLTIRTHNTTKFDGFDDHAEKKLMRLARLLPKVDDVVVEVEHEETRSAAHRYAVQVTVHSAGSILRAEERGADPRVALDLAADVLSRQARRHKKRLHDRHRGIEAKEYGLAAANAPVEADADLEDEVEEYISGNVVRVKQVEMKPMSEQEALAQMDLLGHDFFLFFDARTREYAVLYKRKDGGFGLLAPQRA